MSYIVENNIQLSKNFKLSEFACKHCGRIALDMRLVEVLQKMRNRIGRIEIPIAYRCPTFNKQVCANDPKANPNSYHMYGMAADIHCGHEYNEALRDIAIECGATGVGLYDTFMHVDVGDKRQWDYRTKKYKHYKAHGADVIEVDPLLLSHIWMQGSRKKTPAELVKTIQNYVNCCFYGGDDKPFRLVIQDGLVVSPFMDYDDIEKSKKGTFIVYKDGSTVVKTVGKNDFKSLDISNIKLAFQGFNFNYEANGSKNLISSMNKEGWNDDIHNRNCLRPGFGYNYKTGKVVIAVKKTNAKGLRTLMRNLGCITKDNDTCGIGGDSGGSVALAVDGKLIHDGKRKQVSILRW